MSLINQQFILSGLETEFEYEDGKFNYYITFYIKFYPQCSAIPPWLPDFIFRFSSKSNLWTGKDRQK